MDEFSLINSLKQASYKQASLIKGVGDDMAIFRQTSQDIVTAVDTFVENIHFSRATMDPFYVGYRALAANVSDLAAMGSKPAFYLVSIVIPSHWKTEEIQQIFRGMKKMAGHFQMDLIGGDTVSGKELSISITVIGYVPRDKARYRHLARSGDVVFVTGTLGDSRAGLHILKNPDDYKDRDFYIQRHRKPAPRVSFAMNLTYVSRVALNDISDGIANEAAEIANGSGVTLVLDFAKLPVSDEFHQFTASQQRTWSLFGGEDFELIGTVPRSDWPLVVQAAESTRTRITEIGYVTERCSEMVYLQENDQKRPLEKQGYTHLKQVMQDE
ncbi:thiamine-phosphate kinase [Lentibacillus sp. N15]|uniref:thiamine-phosphate kinase n=1 Tax=Lentibacillus songyuanensis TaxID=3136161 RepID=UPI0031BB92EB